jgi:hypothetical protein
VSIKQLFGWVLAAGAAYGLWVIGVIAFVIFWESYDPLASCEGQVNHHSKNLYPIVGSANGFDYDESTRQEARQWLGSRGYQKAVLAYDVSWRDNGTVISHIIKIKLATTLSDQEKKDKIRNVQYSKRHKEAREAFLEEAGDVNLDQWCIDFNAQQALIEEEAAL